MKRTCTLVLAVIISFAAARAHCESPDWRAELERQLPLLGHRNWIVVADSAYPSQTAPGIKTIRTRQKQLDVIRIVLAAIEKAEHIRAAIFVDTELPHVSEDLAGGIGKYREGLKQVLKDRKPTSLPHEQIIAKLDAAGKTFHVLLLKTDLTLPYTSVFIRLDAGYWSDEAELLLREAIRKAEQSEK